MTHYFEDVPESAVERAERLGCEACHKAGFERVNSVSLERHGLECGRCGAIVLDWRKHQQMCREGKL